MCNQNPLKLFCPGRFYSPSSAQLSFRQACSFLFATASAYPQPVGLLFSLIHKSDPACFCFLWFWPWVVFASIPTLFDKRFLPYRYLQIRSQLSPIFFPGIVHNHLRKCKCCRRQVPKSRRKLNRENTCRVS